MDICHEAGIAWSTFTFDMMYSSRSTSSAKVIFPDKVIAFRGHDDNVLCKPVWIPKILRLVFSSGSGNSIFLEYNLTRFFHYYYDIA